MDSMNIKNKKIGNGYPTYVIAEMSANHGGEFEKAKKIIHEAKQAGADCIKLQTYTADTITMDCDNQYFQLKKGIWAGQNLYQLYKNAFTPWEWQDDLKKEADSIDIDFFSTPFDLTAVDFLESIKVDFYKIASFEITDLPLVKYIASKGKPIIMSTGMASIGEIEEAVNLIHSQGNDQICLLKCSSNYPSISSDMNLLTIQHLKNIFNTPVGLSDHTLGSIAPIIAVSLGASVIEKHFCLSRKFHTADSEFSMEPAEFTEMVKNIRETELALGKVDYNLTRDEMENIFARKSIFAVKYITKGSLFTAENTRIIRPGYGLAPKNLDLILNKRARVNIQKGTPLSWFLVEE